MRTATARTRFRAGFTLVELLICVIIISIIATIAIMKVQGANQRAKEAAVRTQLQMLRTAINQFNADTGRWPLSPNDVTLNTAPANGLNGGGNVKPINAGDYQGPYIIGPAIPPGCDAYFAYTTSPPGTGNIYCPLSGTAMDGSLYSSW
jgi:prepilin-type N-terminal cleavage/methylation domain-containing protein